jgi:DNA (cytosine-5)-methyltransferase 1
MLNGLSLFTGVGGIDVALSEIVRPVAYCEIDPYCQSVLLQRMQESHLPKAPIWDDIRTLPANELPDIDIIYGGFPCQDISVAGLGKGLAGERSGLFFEIMRLAEEIKPKYLFLENVAAITSRGGLEVVRQITEMGYDCRWCVISAASIGALHKRERWFLLAYSQYNGTFANKIGRSLGKCIVSGQDPQKQKESIGTTERASCISSNVAGYDGDTDSIASQQASTCSECISNTKKAWGGFARLYRPFESREHWKKAVSEICRVTDGLPNRVERLKSLGNAVVPQQVRKAFFDLLGVEMTDINIHMSENAKDLTESRFAT